MVKTMNCRNRTINDLCNYEAMLLSVENIPEQIEILERQFTAIQAAQTDKVIVEGGYCDREQAMIDNIARREELAGNLDNIRQKVNILAKALSMLTPTERLVIERFFIHAERNAALRLIDEIGYEKAQVYRISAAALKKLTLAMYGE